MSHSPRDSRSMHKCDSCRKSKKRCEPRDREWPGPKCRPCALAGLPCGPSLSAKESVFTIRGRKHQQEHLNVSDLHYLGAWCIKKTQDVVPIYHTNSHSASPPGDMPQRHHKKSGRGGSALDRHHQALRDTFQIALSEMPDTKEIAGSLSALGRLRILNEVVQSRMHATKFVNNSSQDLLRQALKCISSCITLRRDALVSSIVAAASRSSDFVAESALLRTFRLLEDFGQASSTPSSSSESLSQLKEEIMWEIYQIYESRQDLTEAEHWLALIDRSFPMSKDSQGNSTSDLLAKSFRETSEMVQSEMNDLGVDSDIISNLRVSNPISFPPLHRAVHAGHRDTAKLLLEDTGSARQTDLIGRNVWHIAAENDWEEFYKPFLPTMHKVEERDLFGMTPLAIACWHGHLTASGELLRLGANPECRAADGRKILALAAAAGHVHVVQRLIEAGADVTDRVFPGSSPLYAAAVHKHFKVIKLLLEAGAPYDLFAIQSQPLLVPDTAEYLPETSSETAKLFDSKQHVPPLSPFCISSTYADNPRPLRSQVTKASDKRMLPQDWALDTENFEEWHTCHFNNHVDDFFYVDDSVPES